MPQELRRLLNSHEFLQQAIKEHGAGFSSTELDRVRRECDRIFFELVNYSSTHAEITLAQLNFLLLSLVELASDKSQGEILRRSCLATAQRLATSAPPKSAKAPPPTGDNTAAPALNPVVTPREERLLNSITDRAAICDRDYRYLFVNKANAAFHNLTPADFIGRKIDTVVGKKIFRKLTKPTVDRCIAGESFSLTVGYKSPDKAQTFAAQFAPIRNESGEVVAAMVISRDVTAFPVEPESVWTLPKSSGRSSG